MKEKINGVTQKEMKKRLFSHLFGMITALQRSTTECSLPGLFLACHIWTKLSFLLGKRTVEEINKQ